MKRILYTLVVIVAATLSASAQNRVQDSLWQAGNDSYAMGNFTSAIESYNKILDGGYESAKLYYNLGNSYYRVKNMGKAVVYYKKALKLDPSNADAKANLAMAKARCVDKIEQVPEFMVVTWIKNVRDLLSSDSWAGIGIAAMVVLCIISLFFRYAIKRSRGKTVAFILWVVAFAVVVISFAFSVSAYNKAKGGEEAVVVSAVGSIKSSPSQDGNPIFILHEGTEVKLLETVEDWCKIEIADGRQGWVKSSDLEMI